MPILWGKMSDDELLKALENLRKEEKKKVWIRECMFCGNKEQFKEHPEELCSNCGSEVMRVYRRKPEELEDNRQ